MASKRITKELQVRVHAVRLGARLDRARVARRGGFPGSPRASRETKRWRGVARRAAFRGASETPRGPHRDRRRGTTTERTD